MNVKEISEKLNLKIISKYEGNDRDITEVYSCDLLSLVMGQAPADCAWLTVMGNINTIAVASLADVSCIVLCHNTKMDSDALEKANEQEIAVLSSHEPVFQTALKIHKLIG